MVKKLCYLSKKEFSENEVIQGENIRPGILKLIKVDFPDFDVLSFASIKELSKYRKLYIKNLVKEELGELSNLEQQVLDSIEKNELLSQNIEKDLIEDRTIGQYTADALAKFGGSWVFVISFFGLLFIWVVFNSFFSPAQFDPYPFILLNLLLSCLASIQAPIIMMSQNRKEQKDRIRSENDYKINLKAELEIKLLHEKIDHLLQKHNNRIIEFQEIQIEYLEEILSKLKNKYPPSK